MWQQHGSSEIFNCIIIDIIKLDSRPERGYVGRGVTVASFTVNETERVQVPSVQLCSLTIGVKMDNSEWVWGSGRSGQPKKPKEKKVAICPDCGNPIEIYGTDIGRHKDYGKDSKGKPKKTGPWAWCKRKKWTN